MDSSALDSLVKWANTFEGLSKPCESLTDLSDGVILNDILAQMAPKYFSADGIKKDVEDNFVLKTNNIKKIVANLDKLYQVELGIHDNINIDSAAIGKEQSIPEIVKLVELVLGVLVESEHKAEYLQKIMHLDEVTQRELMVVLEGIINKHQVEMSADHSFHDSSSIAFEDARLVEMQNHIEQLTRELYEEKEQLSDLKQEHAMALEQIKTLRDEREAMQKAVYSLEDALKEEQERAKKEKESFVATIPRQSSQNALAEETTLVFTTQIEERDKTISDLKKKIEELAKQAAEARTLRDELDIMREKVLLTSGLEEKLKKAQQKSEQVADLKKQIKTLEEQNDLYLKKTLDAEDAASKANQFKSHLESYKQQLSTLKAEHTQLEVTLRTQQSDYERMKTDYNNVMLENQALKFRVESLQSEVDDLINSKHGSSMDETIGSLGDEFAPQVKERLAILERENKRLKEGLQIEVEHRVSELNHQLEDANRLNEVLKKELEKGGGGVPSAAAQQEIDMLKDQLAKLNEENSRNLAEINNLLKDKQEYIQYKANNEHLTEKMKAAAEKIAALSAEKTKHEGFLRAAKSIIQEQREQLKQLKDQNAEASKKELEDAVQSYKTQLKEKDQQIEMIKKLWEEGKENSAREQRLMTSAFYDMGLELHRLRTLKSSSSSTPTSPSPSTSSTNLLGSFTPSSTPRSLLANLRQNRE